MSLYESTINLTDLTKKSRFDWNGHSPLHNENVGKKIIFWSATALTFLFIGSLILIAFAPRQLQDTSLNAANNLPTTIAPQATTQLPASTDQMVHTTTPSVQNTSTTSITVNGQSITTPANGTFNETITSNGSQTNVQVQSSHTSSSSSVVAQSGSSE